MNSSGSDSDMSELCNTMQNNMTLSPTADSAGLSESTAGESSAVSTSSSLPDAESASSAPPLPNTIIQQQQQQQQREILRRDPLAPFPLPPAPPKILRRNPERSDSDALSSSSADGSMSRSSSQVSFPDMPEPVEFRGVLIDPFILKNVTLAKDRPFILQVEGELEVFVTRFDKRNLEYPGLNSYQRLIVHRLAAFFKLTHVVDRMKTVILPGLKLRDIPPVDPSIAALDPEPIVVDTPPPVGVVDDSAKSNVQIMQRNGRPQSVSTPFRPNSSQYTSINQPLSPQLPSPSPTNPANQKFEERLEEYNRARERIFREPSSSASSANGSIGSVSSGNASDLGLLPPPAPQIVPQTTRRYTDRPVDNGWYRADGSQSNIRPYNGSNRPRGYQGSRPRPQYPLPLQHPLPPTPTRPFVSVSNEQSHYSQQQEHRRPPQYRPPLQMQMQQQDYQQSQMNHGYIGGGMNMLPQQAPMGYIPIQQADGSVAYQAVMYPGVVPVWFPGNMPVGSNNNMNMQSSSISNSNIVTNEALSPTLVPNQMSGIPPQYGYAPYTGYKMPPSQPLYYGPPGGMMMQQQQPPSNSEGGDPDEAPSL
ncbi:hypothetical protein SmJEL517_g03779 [Synchytrium microbalum]|uniref:SUZ domain-containing protein n=1 Tax=Synchytrium microbalum TaxID=1806994 RepID=A0A507BWX8_9FUNG|nr:uncharacterized protein SmJEL517_g03779 [Synchytrium microbalum]TPX33317.1 hypothetical protein SmJEL517_g03779 [Synchytrium microbalum]